MRHLSRARVFGALAVLLVSQPASAQGVGNGNKGNGGGGGPSCTSVSASEIVFGNYSPFGPGVSGTSTITYSCPNGVSVASIAISAPRVVASGTDALTFVLTQTPGVAEWLASPPVTVPVAKSGTVTVYGFIRAGQDVSAGAYDNFTVPLTVSLYADSGRVIEAPLRVSATVPAVCTIAPAALAFGNYDPIGANATTPSDTQTAIQIACTRNTGYTVALGPGNFAAGTTRQMASGTERLEYELYKDSGRAAVWNAVDTVGGTAPSMASVSLTVYGRIRAGQVVAAGDYADTVLSTINF